MKLPFKYIAILVIVSLAGIFAYQAYWLTGLYHTMHSEMERDITEAMRMSDYNEMMIRVDKMKQDDINHGEVSVSAGYSDDGKSFVRSSTTISREDSLDNATLHETFMPKGDSVYVTHPNDSTRVEVSVRKNVPLLTKEDSVLFIDQYRETDKVRWMSADSAREPLEEAVRDSDSSPQSALSAKERLDVILRDQNSMLELATYFQRGLHSGLDIISDPDVVLYDSLLTSFLHDRNINLPHRLLHLHKGSKWDSTILYIDTLVNIGTPGYVPTSKAVEYNYSFDINTNQSYRLIMEPAGMIGLATDVGHSHHIIRYSDRTRFLLLVLDTHHPETEDTGRDEERFHQQHHPRTENPHRRSICRQRRSAQLQPSRGKGPTRQIPAYLPGTASAPQWTG